MDNLRALASDKDLIERSVSAYRRNHRRYESERGEIFTEIEQLRLRALLERAVASIQSATGVPNALDLGCGTGNLTRHLVDLGVKVTAADVSTEFLDVIRTRYADAAGQVATAVLNGADLREFPDASLDLIGIYSVLHHVPDYLGLLVDCMRVLKPGGVVVVDHEVNDSYWHPPKELVCFRAEAAAAAPPKSPRRFLQPSRYILRLRTLIDPRFQHEGDVHVWPDDHIEWDAVEQTIQAADGDILERTDYLLYRTEYPIEIYRRHSTTCSDVACLVARKRPRICDLSSRERRGT